MRLWGVLGASCGLGASQERLEAVLRASWGRLWSFLGASWGILRASWGVLGASWGRFGVVLERLGNVLARLGRVLGPLLDACRFVNDFQLILAPKSDPRNLKNH